MWWLLTYAAYVIGASVVIAAGGYAAVTQLAVLQRLLAVALERWLRQITANLDGTSNGFRVWHTDQGEKRGVPLLSGVGHPPSPSFLVLPSATLGLIRPGAATRTPQPPLGRHSAGVEVAGVEVGSRVLRLVHKMGEQLAAASVEHIELVFPTFTRPLTARISGLSLHVQQVKLPKVRPRLLPQCTWRFWIWALEEAVGALAGTAFA
jgi:hypothetical protein